MEVPIIDFEESDSNKLAEAWDEAMSKVGFACIVNHGVPQKSLANIRTQALKFFEGTDRETKLKYQFHEKYGGPLGGFTPSGQEAVERSKGDTSVSGGNPVESYVFKVEDKVTGIDRPEIHDEDFARAADAYVGYISVLLERIHEVSLLALNANEEESALLKKSFSKNPRNALRLAYYLPLSEGNACSARYGAHTDYQGFTILHPDPIDRERDYGLEVFIKDEGTESGTWYPVKCPEGGFIVNAGDLWPIWASGKWKSPLHRVTGPSDGRKEPSRLSIVFFTGPEDDMPVASLPDTVNSDGSGVLTAGEHLFKKLGISNVK